MRQKRCLLLTKIATISVLVVFLSLLPNIKTNVVHASTNQVMLKATDDTYVDSSYPTSNYGGQFNLEILNSLYGTAPYQSTFIDIIWLKFNLSSVPNGALIDTATLQLYASGVGETYNVDAYSCSDNSWNELTLTYSNMPSYNTALIDSELVPSAFEWYNWSVVDAVRSALNTNSTQLTLVLNEPTPHSSLNGVSFYSKESFLENLSTTDYSPELIVHWTAVTREYPTLLLIPLTIITTAVVAAIFYKRKRIIPAARHKSFWLVG